MTFSKNFSNIFFCLLDIFVSIKDTGIGMYSNTQKKIFEKFYREQSGNILDVKGHGF